MWKPLASEREEAVNRFQNKTVLITGAAGGTGTSRARGFIREGAKVVVTDIRDHLGRSLAEELGDRAHYARLDVTQEADRAAAVRESESRFGPLSVLVDNAGVLSPSALIEDGDPADR